MLNYRLFYLLGIAMFLACSSKKHATSNENIPRNTDSPTKTSHIAPAQINIFLETSGSMKGYFAGQEFVGTITKLPTIAEGIANNKNVKINLIADNITPYTKTAFDFSNEVSTQGAAFCKGKSSEMSKLFKTVADNTHPTSVSLFVSDCILSFSNQATNAVNVAALEAGIRSTFTEIQRKGFAVSIYAFESTFKGSYFTMNNSEDRSYADGSQRRPFYVWAIGKKDLLEGFRKQIANDAAFQPLQSLHIGFGYQVIKDYTILAQMIPQRGRFRVEKYTKIHEIEDIDERPISFYIGINANQLPPYAIGLLLDEKKLKLSGQGITGNIQKIETDLMPYNPVAADIEKMKHCTHFVKLQLTKIVPDKASLLLQLPFEPNNWYKTWSTLDDTSPSNNKGKTFAFANLVNGVQEAYKEQQQFENFIDVKVELEKE